MKKVQKNSARRWDRRRLLTLGIPAVLIPGILIAITLGWNPANLTKFKDYYAVKTLFPKSGVVRQVHDGDTFVLQSGVEVRLIGIDAPNRGEGKWREATKALTTFINGQRIYLSMTATRMTNTAGCSRGCGWIARPSPRSCQRTTCTLPTTLRGKGLRKIRKGVKRGGW